MAPAILSPTPSRNLAQIRALNAVKAAEDGIFAGQNGGEVAKKIPAYIIESGLLGALAFALEKGGGHRAVFQAVLTHLQSIEDPIARNAADPKAWFEKLAKADVSQLRAATAETMAYLAFLRRFAKKESNQEKDHGEQ
ncbi:MAG: type III-B CRISPR module-associated protein Cmr5 [Candidatus Spyradenecus sp.]